MIVLAVKTALLLRKVSYNQLNQVFLNKRAYREHIQEGQYLLQNIHSIQVFVLRKSEM